MEAIAASKKDDWVSLTGWMKQYSTNTGVWLSYQADLGVIKSLAQHWHNQGYVEFDSNRFYKYGAVGKVTLEGLAAFSGIGQADTEWKELEELATQFKRVLIPFGINILAIVKQAQNDEITERCFRKVYLPFLKEDNYYLWGVNRNGTIKPNPTPSCGYDYD